MERLSVKSLEKLLELVQDLEWYPAVDDEAVAEYEYKAIMQAWKQWYRHDVKRGLRSKVEALLKSNTMDYACIEMGGNAYIDTELLVKYL